MNDPNNGAMMGGANPNGASVISEPEPDLTDDDLRVLLSEDEEPESRRTAPQPPDAGDDIEDDDGDTQDDELQKLRLQLAQAQGAIATLMRGGNTQANGGSPQDPVDEFANGFFQKPEFAGVPEETQAFFREFGKGLLSAVGKQMGGRLQNIEQSLQQSSGKAVLQEFESQLGTVMDRAGLTEAEQELFKESVMMDGLRRYGNNFNTQQAISLFRSKHKRYLEARADRDQRTEAELEDDIDTAPPATRRNGNVAAREDVESRLMRSTSRENTFGGRNWRKHIHAKLQRMARGGA